MRRRLLTGLAVLLAAGCLFGGRAAAQASDIVVREVVLSEYPRVQLVLDVPGSGAVEASAPDFVVIENSRRAEVIKATQVEAEPVDVMLVIDTSGSMKGAPLAAAKAAAQAFIGELQVGSRVGVMAFAQKPVVAAPLMETSASELAGAIDGLTAGGETALYDALRASAEELERVGAQHPIVIVLSDGGDTASRGTLDDALKSLRAIDARALVVALPTAEADAQVLETIASQTGGRYLGVAESKNLAGVYRDLGRQLRTTWLVTYVSWRPSTKDLDIEVQATRQGQVMVGSVVSPNPTFEASVPDAGLPAAPPPPASAITLFGAGALVFVSVFAFTAALILLLVRPKTALENIKYYDQLQEAGDIAGDEGYTGRVVSSVMGAVDYVAGKRGLKKFVYDQLEQAGLPLRPTEYITLHLVAVIATGALTQFLSGNLLLSIVAVVFMTLLPLALLDIARNRRREAFERQLPDVLNLIAGALRAGWGLQQAIDLVVEQMAPPVTNEFARAQTEIRLGKPVEEALDGIVGRTQSQDLSWAVAAIGIQRDVGGNLAEVLDIVASTIRDRNALKRQIAALTAEGRLSAWILMLLPFVLIGLLMVVNPEYLSRLFTTAPGFVMLVLGAVLLVIGGIWLRRVVTIEV